MASVLYSILRSFLIVGRNYKENFYERYVS